MPPGQSNHNGAYVLSQNRTHDPACKSGHRSCRKFRRERTRTYTRTICLEDTVHFANLIGSYAQARAGSCTNGIGRSDKRIRTEINIEHRTCAPSHKTDLPSDSRPFISCSLSTNLNCFRYSIPSNHAFSSSLKSYS